MHYTQISSIVNEVLPQLAGDAELDNFDATNIAEVGRLSATIGYDVVFKTLADRIGKFIADNRLYVGDAPHFDVEPLEWGNIVESIKSKPATTRDSDMYNDGNFVDEHQFTAHIFYAPTIQARYWHEQKPIDIRMSFPEKQLKSACTSWADFNKILSVISTSIENGFARAYEAIAHMLASSAIATVSESNRLYGNFVKVKLLTEYNTLFGTQLTAENALHTKEFLRYMSKRIKNYVKYSKRYNLKYNDGSIETFSNKEDLQLILLNEVDSSLSFYLYADTFNADMLNIGKYSTVVSWQGSGIDDEYDSMSTVMVSKCTVVDKNGGTHTSEPEEGITVSNVIGLLHDRRAIAFSPIDETTRSEYTASGDFTTYYYTRLANYLINTSETMILFTLD